MAYFAHDRTIQMHNRKQKASQSTVQYFTLNMANWCDWYEWYEAWQNVSLHLQALFSLIIKLWLYAESVMSDCLASLMSVTEEFLPLNDKFGRSGVSGIWAITTRSSGRKIFSKYPEINKPSLCILQKNMPDERNIHPACTRLLHVKW